MQSNLCQTIAQIIPVQDASVVTTPCCFAACASSTLGSASGYNARLNYRLVANLVSTTTHLVLPSVVPRLFFHTSGHVSGLDKRERSGLDAWLQVPKFMKPYNKAYYDVAIRHE